MQQNTSTTHIVTPSPCESRHPDAKFSNKRRPCAAAVCGEQVKKAINAINGDQGKQSEQHTSS